MELLSITFLPQLYSAALKRSEVYLVFALLRCSGLPR